MSTSSPFESALLGTLLLALKDGTHGTHVRTREGVPFLSAKNVTDAGVVWNGDDDCISEAEYHSIHRNFRLEVDDLLLTVVGSLGRRALHDGSRVTFQRSVAFLRADSQRLLPLFLFHATGVGRFQQALVQRSNATAQAGVYLGEIGRIRVEIPSLPEQRQIAAILDTIDDAIRKTEQIIAKLKQVKQGLLHDLLTRGIDDNGELRDPERHTEQFKDSALGRIPRGWEVLTLSDIAEIRSGIAKNSNRAIRNGCFVHYLRVANVQDGFLDLSEMSEIEVESSDLDRYGVLPGDVLMNEGGDLDKLGRGAIWRGEYDPCVHQNHVFAVRCGSRVQPEFLNAWTGAAPARSYFMIAGKQTTNLASINETALGRMPIAVPREAEQIAIVANLEQHDRRVTTEGTAASKLRLLKQGLMEDLLTGRVRVTKLLEGAAE